MIISFKVNRRSGDYVRSTVVPAHRADKSRFGVLDGVIVALFLATVAVLFYLAR